MKLLLAAALLAPQAVPDPDPLCTDIRRLAEAAKDEASFDALAATCCRAGWGSIRWLGRSRNAWSRRRSRPAMIRGIAKPRSAKAVCTLRCTKAAPSARMSDGSSPS